MQSKFRAIIGRVVCRRRRDFRPGEIAAIAS
jgi:hypothetical protein